MNDLVLTQIWGLSTSVGLSVAKWLKLPSALCPILNVILAGGGCFAYLTLHEGKAPMEALPLAVSAVASACLAYKGITQPIKVAIQEEKETEKKTEKEGV